MRPKLKEGKSTLEDRIDGDEGNIVNHRREMRTRYRVDQPASTTTGARR